MPTPPTLEETVPPPPPPGPDGMALLLNIPSLSPRVRELYENVLAETATGTPIAEAARRAGIELSNLLVAVRKYPFLSARFEAARMAQAEQYLSEVNTLANEVLEAEPNRVKAFGVAISTKQWLVEKIAPSTYGPRSESIITHRTEERELTTAEKLAKFRREARGEPIDVTPPADATAEQPSQPDAPTEEPYVNPLD